MLLHSYFLERHTLSLALSLFCFFARKSRYTETLIMQKPQVLRRRDFRTDLYDRTGETSRDFKIVAQELLSTRQFCAFARILIDFNPTPETHRK